MTAQGRTAAGEVSTVGKSKKAKGVLQVLTNDTPHGFSRAIACKLGYDEAIVIQQIHYTATNERDGRLWAYNTPPRIGKKSTFPSGRKAR